MERYTTGELAKLCKVSVRTVQYYDERGILTPSELTEGGRRLFSEQDVKTMETICFLRGMGISINDIAKILTSKEEKGVVELLLSQKQEELEHELQEKTEQVKKLRDLKGMLGGYQEISHGTLHDMSIVLEGKKRLKRLYLIILLVGIPLEIGEIASLVVGIMTGNWICFAAGLVISLILGLITYKLWYKNILYLCPECHQEFKPKAGEAFAANHTPKTRKLTCPNCRKKLWCVETYDFRA